MNRRPGYSLIELSAVMSVCAVLAGISVWLVHMSMQKTREGQRHLESQQTVARLAEGFRRDVHAAVSLAPAGGEKAAWDMLLGSGGCVRYRLETGRVIRDEFAAGDAKTAVAHETFNLAPTAKVAISLEPPAEPHLAALSIAAVASSQNSQAMSGQATLSPVCITAAISLDQSRKQIVLPREERPAAASEAETPKQEETTAQVDKKTSEERTPEQKETLPSKEVGK